MPPVIPAALFFLITFFKSINSRLLFRPRELKAFFGGNCRSLFEKLAGVCSNLFSCSRIYYETRLAGVLSNLFSCSRIYYETRLAGVGSQSFCCSRIYSENKKGRSVPVMLQTVTSVMEEVKVSYQWFLGGVKLPLSPSVRQSVYWSIGLGLP